MTRLPDAPRNRGRFTTPDVLIVGHIARDLTADGWLLGGAAYYAARTASLRGLRVAVYTSAPSDIADAARAALPGVTLAITPSTTATTFDNRYQSGARLQYLRALAAPLRADNIPRAWRAAPVALLAPVAHEFGAEIAESLRARTLGLAPQGWLRVWDADGRVWPASFAASQMALLGRCAAVVVSSEDLVGVAPSDDARSRAEETARNLAGRVACLVVTRGPAGAEVWQEGRAELIAGFPAHELDPTGAGDVFAMTLLCALAAGATPAQAAREANQVAALSVEGVGASAIPTPEAARARFGP